MPAVRAPSLVDNKQSPTTKALKLRVQNMCCGKEGNLVKSILNDTPGISNVNVNIVGRTCFVHYENNVISPANIVDRLNSKHLGASVLASGDGDGNKPANSRAELLLHIEALSIIVMGGLFIAVIVTHIKGYAAEEWLAISIFVIGGVPLLYRIFVDFKRCVFVNINLLIMIAACGAVVLQDWIDASIVVYIFDVAKFLENRSKYQVEKYIGALMTKAPEKAVIAETNELVKIEDIPIGTVISITAGERIALDGVVVGGKAAVDESSLTGEAVPIPKEKDNLVCSGTIVQSGFLKVKTTCDYQSSTVYRISQVVSEAQSKSSHTEEFLNTFAKYYTPFVLLVSLTVFTIPLVMYKSSRISREELNVWIIRALTILMGACPCSVLMAAPIPAVSSIAKAAKLGVLIRGGMYLENLAKLDVVVFDKTGTLTAGRFEVLKEHSLDEESTDKAIKLAASLEIKSSHPLSASIVTRYSSGCIATKLNELGEAMGLFDVTDFKSHDGMGLSGTVEGHQVYVGNIKLMEFFETHIGLKERSMIQNWSMEGCTVILIGVDNKLKLLLGVADKIRPTAKAVVQGLQDMGIECVMLTGDNEGAASAVQCHTGVTFCGFGLTPEEKRDWIRKAKKDGKKKKRKVVAMVGDGVNDSPSLVSADVGIAIGLSGSAIAVESAGISLMTDNLTQIVDVVQLGKFYQKIVWQNIFLGITIKGLFVVAAVIAENMLWMAVVSDVLALLIVILNGVRPSHWEKKEKTDKNIKIEKTVKTENDKTPLMGGESDIDIENYANLSRGYAAERISSLALWNKQLVDMKKLNIFDSEKRKYFSSSRRKKAGQ